MDGWMDDGRRRFIWWATCLEIDCNRNLLCRPLLCFGSAVHPSSHPSHSLNVRRKLEQMPTSDTLSPLLPCPPNKRMSCVTGAKSSTWVDPSVGWAMSVVCGCSWLPLYGVPGNVKTEDGYVLGLQRIPEGRVAAGNVIRGPVLLQHGVLMDGMTWLLDTPEQSLGFVLADSGFDVWISNTRGTRWSRTHTSLDPIDPDYWAWSWDELVDHDLPTIFDFVYSQTGQKLLYVGHSMGPFADIIVKFAKGTLTALAAFSQGKLVDQLKSAALLSPVAYLSHMTTSIGQLAAKALVGENMRYYGESTPPIYNMSNIPNDLPLFLSYGGQDALSDVGDVMLLLDNLKFHDGDKLTIQFIKDFAHADFVMGVSAKRIGLDRVLLLLLLLGLLGWATKEAHAAKHTVGGSDGWDVTADLDTWAAGQTFRVGDELGEDHLLPPTSFHNLYHMSLFSRFKL
ncbi:hypothetical protein ACLOJK_039830 [Asimina triloba]